MSLKTKTTAKREVKEGSRIRIKMEEIKRMDVRSTEPRRKERYVK